VPDRQVAWRPFQLASGRLRPPPAPSFPTWSDHGGDAELPFPFCPGATLRMVGSRTGAVRRDYQAAGSEGYARELRGSPSGSARRLTIGGVPAAGARRAPFRGRRHVAGHVPRITTCCARGGPAAGIGDRSCRGPGDFYALKCTARSGRRQRHRPVGQGSGCIPTAPVKIPPGPPFRAPHVRVGYPRSTLHPTAACPGRAGSGNACCAPGIGERQRSADLHGAIGAPGAHTDVVVLSCRAQLLADWRACVDGGGQSQSLRLKTRYRNTDRLAMTALETTNPHSRAKPG
jgi:hypothetical protein